LWDGGNLKISVNGGPFTLVPQSAYQFNAPPAQLNTVGDGNTNPMAGEFAWTGTDDGENTGSWGTTIVNLASLAAPGNTVRVEFDFGIDGCNGATGWFVDNVEFYDCPAVDLQPPLQNAIADDASPDQTEGVDRDGSFVLSWSYPGTATQPCGFTIEEAVDVSPVSFQDDAEEPLVLGSNSTWSGNPQWHSEPHPDTGTIGYSVLYTDFLNTSLTMISPFSIPADAGARLSFDSFEDVEGGFDFIYVEVSADGGSSFVEVMRSSGFFSGRREIDLGSFSGQSILVRFRLTSDFVFSFPLFQGWFIDNIRIDTSVLFTEVAQVSGSIFSYNITGRGNGTYSYRIAGLFGGCDSTPFFGPYSNVRQITVDVVPTVRPTADFTMSPNPADVNETVIFDASASADNDDIGSGPEIVRYQWFFGDGTSATSTTPTTTHAYSAAGSYRVFLTVTDNDGETGSTDQLLTVIEFGDVAGSGQIRTSANQAKFAFDVSNAGGTPAGSLSYHDGGMKVASEGISSLTIDGNQATFSGPCKVNKQTGFTFEVVVTDNGSGATDTFTIRLSNGYQASGTLSKGNIEIDAQ